jgi:TatD DNase family protein
MLIDTHCHLHDEESFPDPEPALQAAREAGVERIVVVGVNPPDWKKAVACAERFDAVFAIVGWHPNYTADYDRQSLSELASLLAHPKVLALGEIGLDYHWDYSPVETQRRALADQLDLAVELDLPVVFHAREAYSDLLDVLEKRAPQRYLFHCFAGNADEADRAVALDAYFGVDGPITYKKADELRSVIARLPKERVVVETDSPYMAPVPYRGKPNQPAYVALVAEALAKLWSVPQSEAAEVTTRNAARFFGELLVSSR